MKVLAKNGKPFTTSGKVILPPSKQLQMKTVSLSMASGDQVIIPDEEYSLSKVTVTKPDTLIPDNIKKDVDIGGVVGTMEGGGVSGKRSVTFSDGDAASGSYIYYVEDGVFKEALMGAGAVNTITIAADYGTTIYVETLRQGFSSFIPTVEGATATNYIEKLIGKTYYAYLMYILEQ